MEDTYLNNIRLQIGIALSKQLHIKGLLLHRESFKTELDKYVFVKGKGIGVKLDEEGNIRLDTTYDRYMGYKVYYSEQSEPNEINIII